MIEDVDCVHIRLTLPVAGMEKDTPNIHLARADPKQNQDSIHFICNPILSLPIWELSGKFRVFKLGISYG